MSDQRSTLTGWIPRLIILMVMSCGIGGCDRGVHAQLGPPRYLWTGQVNESTGADLQMEDLDGDGVKDIITQSNVAPGFQWLRMNANGSVAGFRYFHGTRFYGPKTLFFDQDNDGDLDVVFEGSVLGSGGGIYRAENLGQGNFGPFSMLCPNYGDPKAAADVDQDGDIDLFIGDPDSVLWLNDGSGGFALSTLLNDVPVWMPDYLVFDGDNDGDVDVVTTDEVLFIEQTPDGFVSSANAQDGPLGITRATDWDMDGDIDLVGLSFPSNELLVTWSRNNGSGYFSPQVSLGQTQGGRPTLYDWDDDGDADVVYTAYGAIKVMLNNAGTLEAPLALGSVSSVPLQSIVAEDVNGDGTRDIVLLTDHPAVYVMLRTGPNTLSSPIRLNSLPGSMKGADFADVDNDGVMDMLLVTDGWSPPDTLSSVAWCPGTGSGGFGDPVIIDQTHAALQNMVARDFNADGDVDVVAADPSVDRFFWFENDDSPAAWVEHSIDPGGAINPSFLHVADVDGNGTQDVVGRYSSGTVFAMLHDGNGSYNAVTIWPDFPTPAWESNPNRWLKMVDLDGDGDLDFLGVIYPGGFVVEVHRVLNEGGGVFAPVGTVASMVITDADDSFCVFDADADSDMDFLIGGFTEWLVYENDGAGVFSSGTLSFPGGPMDSYVYDAADLNADGICDFLVRNAIGITSAHLSHPQGYDVVAMDWTFFPGRECSFRDFDGDGDLDVISMFDLVIAWENFWEHEFSAEGQVFIDEDQSGTWEPNEPGLEGAINCTPGSLWSYSIDGAFRLALAPGDYQVAQSPMQPIWTTTLGAAGYEFTLSETNPVVDGLLFGLDPGPDSTVVSVSMVSGPTRCDQTVVQDINLKNLGNTHVEGTLSAWLDPMITFVESEPPPASISNGVISWSIGSIGFFETARIRMQCTMPSFTSIGDQLNAALLFESTDGSGNANGAFTAEWQSILTCAYDPNDKQVSPQGVGTLGQIDVETQHLDYTVRFQNTGNDTALTVVVVDQFSPHLDLASLQILGASHPLTNIAAENDGTLVFRFDGIMLPDSNVNEPMSHGYVQFRVRLRSGLPVGTVISNTAGILFDLNPPVVTNTTYNVLMDCSGSEAEISESQPGVLSASAGLAYRWYRDDALLLGATQQQLSPSLPGAYVVEVLLPDGCWARSGGYWYSESGMENLVSSSLRIYPNPFSSSLVVQASPAFQKSDELRLTDVLGRVVLRMPCTNDGPLVLETSELSGGAYLVQVVRAGEVVGAIRAVRE